MLKELFDMATKKAGNQERLGEILGLPQSRVSAFRNYKGKGKKPSDALIGELAEYVGLNPIEVILLCKEETDKEKASLWLNWLSKYEWRPHGDSNPGYRRERASAWKVFVKHILGIKNTPKTPQIPLYHPFIITELELN